MKPITINGLDFEKLNEEELDAIKYYINRRLNEIEEGVVIKRTWYYYIKIYSCMGAYTIESVTKEEYDLFKKYMSKVAYNGECIADCVKLIESFDPHLEQDDWNQADEYLKAINTYILKNNKDVAVTGRVDTKALNLLPQESESTKNIDNIINFLIS